LPFTALNGGPLFVLEAISLQIFVDQKGLDYYWDRLTKGAIRSPRVRLAQDKYGLSGGGAEDGRLWRNDRSLSAPSGHDAHGPLDIALGARVQTNYP
jgi:hypothetical protein